jgi:hypothetical protein
LKRDSATNGYKTLEPSMVAEVIIPFSQGTLSSSESRSLTTATTPFRSFLSIGKRRVDRSGSGFSAGTWNEARLVAEHYTGRFEFI